MTARLLDGRAVASRLWRELSARVEALQAASGAAPRLAILRFDESGPSALYASSLERAARSVGVEPISVLPPPGVGLSDLAARITALNLDPTVAGIVVAQPLPDHLELPSVTELIDPGKDVDGATWLSAGRLAHGYPAFVPATALAVVTILNEYEIPLAGRHAVVIGRSSVVGKPVATLLTAAHATVVLCHRRTRNLARETRRAEILVAAAGVRHLVRAEMVSRGAVVVDCGINVTPDGIVGDVDTVGVRPLASAITPVPGGVGPVTTMCLLQQTIVSAERLAATTADDESLIRFSPIESPR
jgi:methylenetetrahydrofolate dehydrogenase (NADP+)/methenyltetrahydrofolate cyclohydrolase